MAQVFGVVHAREDAPADRTVRRAAKHLGALDLPLHEVRDGGAVFVRRGGDAAAVYEDDDLVVMLDGWVAFADGRRGQGDARHRDAAAVAQAWRTWGIDLVRYVEGAFAVVVYERATGVLHLVRDAVGRRPLFWARAPGRFAFASDLHALLGLPWVRRTLARDEVAEYLAFRVVHAPRTLLTDVKQVVPGHRLRVDADGVREQRWHRPVYAAPGTATPRELDVIPELTAAIEASVARHLDDDRRIGVYLSGGVGSSSLVAAARSASASLQTWTVTFAENPFPESPFAGRVAGLLGMTHHTVRVGSKDVADRFDDAVRAPGLPIGNVSTVLQLLLAEAAANEVDVVLTGDGTDQLFGGNMLAQPAAVLRRSETFHKLPSPMRLAARRALGVVGRGTSVEFSPMELARREGFGGERLFDERQRHKLLLDESAVHPNVRSDVLGAFYDEVQTDPLNAVLHAFFQSTLVADTLPRVVSTAAAAGLDTGFPLLDREVSRLAHVLPGAFKLGGATRRADLPTRWLLRTALQGSLPAALVNRADRGMPRPLDDWLTGAGRLFMEERFARLAEDPLELFHVNHLEALKRGLGTQPGASQRLWALLILDQWMRDVRAT